jgi:septal ring factor EnvC (AmiA/AmiB activator)
MKGNEPIKDPCEGCTKKDVCKFHQPLTREGDVVTVHLVTSCSHRLNENEEIMKLKGEKEALWKKYRDEREERTKVEKKLNELRHHVKKINELKNLE